MMIDAVMYGMIPSANTANWVMAPPEKVCSRLSTPLESDRLISARPARHRRQVARCVSSEALIGIERSEQVGGVEARVRVGRHSTSRSSSMASRSARSA